MLCLPEPSPRSARWMAPWDVGGDEANGTAGHLRCFPRAMETLPKILPWAALAMRRCGNVEPNPCPPLPPPGSGPCARRGPPVHPRTGHGSIGAAGPGDPRVGWPGPLSGGTGTIVWPVLQCTPCLRPMPTADGGATFEFHLRTCRFWPKTEKVRRTRVAMGPDALPQIHLARRTLPQRRQAPRPNQGEDRSARVGIWSPTRPQATRRMPGSQASDASSPHRRPRTAAPPLLGPRGEATKAG